LSPEDKVKTNDFAAKFMSSVDEAQKNHVRQMMQNRMTPAQPQELVGQGRDLTLHQLPKTGSEHLSATSQGENATAKHINQRQAHAKYSGQGDRLGRGKAAIAGWRKDESSETKNE
jgi:hypothetical protein